MAGTLVLGILLGIHGVHLFIWLTVAVGGFFWSWHLMKQDGRGMMLRTDGVKFQSSTSDWRRS